MANVKFTRSNKELDKYGLPQIGPMLLSLEESGGAKRPYYVPNEFSLGKCLSAPNVGEGDVDHQRDVSDQASASPSSANE